MTQGIFMYGLINLVLGMAGGMFLVWIILKPERSDNG